MDGLPSLSGLDLACPQLSGKSERSTCVGHKVVVLHGVCCWVGWGLAVVGLGLCSRLH